MTCFYMACKGRRNDTLGRGIENHSSLRLQVECPVIRYSACRTFILCHVNTVPCLPCLYSMSMLIYHPDCLAFMQYFRSKLI